MAFRDSVLGAVSALASSSIPVRSVIAQAKTKLQGVRADAETLQAVTATGHQDLDRDISEVREELNAKEMALKILEERMMQELGEFRAFAEAEVEKLRRDVEEKDRNMKQEVAVKEGEWQGMMDECVQQRRDFSKGMLDNESKIDQFGEKVRLLKVERDTLTLKLRAEVKRLEADIEIHHNSEMKEQRAIYERVCNEIDRLKNQSDRSLQEAEEKWTKDADTIDEFAINLAALLQRELSAHH